MKSKVICSLAFDFDCNFNFSKALIKFQGFEFVFHNGRPEHYDIIEGLLSSWDEVESFMQTVFEYCLAISFYNHHCSFYYDSNFIIGGVDDDFDIYNNKPRIRVPRNPIYNNVGLYRIKALKTEEQKLTAALWNDAQDTNNPFFKFLCYWKIIEIPVGGSNRNAEIWINDTLAKKPKFIDSSERLKKMIKDGKDIGRYFKENFRNAITHISRPPNLSTYKHKEYRDVSIANFDLLLLVEYFLKNEIHWEKENPRTNIIKSK